MTDASKSDTSSDEDLCRLLNSLEPLFESLEQLETNVLANWGTELPDNRVLTVDAGTVRKIKLMAGKLRELVE
jgi:hypothetical protein